MVEILHNPHCSKSQCALGYLKENDIDFQLREYKKESLNKEELKKICRQIGIAPKQLIRTQEKIFKEQFKGKTFTDDEWLAILEEYPTLMKRPIIINNENGKSKAVIGRPAEKIKEIL